MYSLLFPARLSPPDRQLCPAGGKDTDQEQERRQHETIPMSTADSSAAQQRRGMRPAYGVHTTQDKTDIIRGGDSGHQTQR